jgi:hypothetical protein
MQRHLLSLVRTLRVATLVRTLRVSAAARWQTVQELRLQTRTVLGERRAQRRGGRSTAAPSSRPANADDWLEVEVLRVIARHPEGVRALDIGNELGVDWRRVPVVAGRLVERAKVEQIAHEFYPVKKAS